MRRTCGLGLVLCAVLAASVLPASANGGIAMAVDVTNSSQTVRDREGGQCTWEVTSEIVIVNLRSEPNTIDAVSYAVSWLGPNDTSGVVTSINVLSDAGLRPGVTIPPDGRQSFFPLTLQFDVPCDATFGDLAVRVTSALGTGSGDAPFLEDGTPVPPGAIGAIGLALVLTAYIAWVERRRRLALVPATVRRGAER